MPATDTEITAHWVEGAAVTVYRMRMIQVACESLLEIAEADTAGVITALETTLERVAFALVVDAPDPGPEPAYGPPDKPQVGR